MGRILRQIKKSMEENIGATITVYQLVIPIIMGLLNLMKIMKLNQLKKS